MTPPTPASDSSSIPASTGVLMMVSALLSADCKFNCHKRCSSMVPRDCLGEVDFNGGQLLLLLCLLLLLLFSLPEVQLSNPLRVCGPFQKYISSKFLC